MFEEVLKLCKNKEVRVAQQIAVGESHIFIGDLHPAQVHVIGEIEVVDLLGDWFIQEKNVVIGFSAEDVAKVIIEPKSCSKPSEIWIHINLKYRKE